MPAQQYPIIGTAGVIGMFFQELDIATGRTWIPQICTELSSTQATETYAGLGLAPMLREWIGGKEPKGFNELSLKITNKDFEGTLQIMNKDLRRDKTDQLRIRIGSLADRAAAHDAKLLSDIIDNGAGTTKAACYDTKALFDTGHSVGASGTINNKISVTIANLATGGTGTHGSTTLPSIGEFALSVQQGIKQMFGFKDDVGEPINEMAREFVVMVPVGLSDVAAAAVNQPNLALGMQNPLVLDTSIKKTVVVNPRLTWTDRFAVFRADGRAKALIKQIEFGPVMKALAEGSDYEFQNNAQLFSVEKAGNVGYLRFDQCCQVIMV